MSQIRIGIIGAGGRGINAFGNIFQSQFADQARLLAVADPNRDRAAAGLEAIGAQADIHADYRAMLARKDIDAVVVTTPDYLHEEHCIAAFRRGKHVLVDKPLAISAGGCLRVIAAAHKARKILYMGFNLRHDVVLRRIKNMLAEGQLGRVFSMHAVEYYNGGRTYMARWNRLKKYAGSLFIHKGSHDFDIINWFMQPARPVRVSCFANVFCLHPKGLPFKTRPGVKPGPTCSACAYQAVCPDVNHLAIKSFAGVSADKLAARNRMFDANAAKKDGYHKDLCIYLSDKDTHDQGVAIVEYDNGAVAMHSECFVTPLTDRLYRLDGTLGHLEASLHENRIEIRPRWSQDQSVHKLSRGAGGHGGADPHMCAEFMNCIRQGLRPGASGIDGAWSVAIGEACELSRTKKRMVEIREVLDVKSPLLKK